MLEPTVFAIADGLAGAALLALGPAPHFYATRWFHAACLLLLVLAIYQGYRMLTREIRVRNERLRREIARRERMEEALRASEAKFATVYRASPDAIVLSSLADGTFLDVNEVFAQSTGYRREDLIGRSSLELGLWTDPEDRRLIADVLRAGRVARNVETTFKHRSGKTLAIQISSGLVEIDGRPTVVSVIRDVSESKRAEREREELIRELEAKNAELERFSYTVSHDLKSPLVTIKGFLGLLEKDAAAGDADRLRRDIERIGSAADRMTRLLEELLELSRIGRMMNRPQPVALAGIAAEACEIVGGAIAERGADVEIAPDLPTVAGDRARLIEVYQNLIENAVKHIGEKVEPRIEVGWRRDGEEAVFFVRDNGIGIEPRFHEKVFGLFERLDAAAEGTGVGLTLVKRIVEVHGGRIWIESEGRGRGSTFCFTLPAA